MKMKSPSLVFTALAALTVACGPQSLTESGFIPIGVTPPEASGTANILNASNELFTVAAANEAAISPSFVSLANNGSRHGNQSSGTSGTASNSNTEASSPNNPNAASNANAVADANNTANTTKSSGTDYELKGFTQEVWPAHQFNDEQQNYTSGGKNVTFAADGTTTIVARPTGGTGWTSARLSGPTLEETGGIPQYVEATLSLPTGKGSWPAFWLTSRGSWPQGSEVDVTEVVNGVNESHISTHWGASTGNATFNTHEIIKNVDVSKAHRYGAYITDTGVQFYLDGAKVGSEVTLPGAAKFSTLAPNLVPIVNLAMGGTFPGDAPQSTGEQTMIVHAITHSKTAPK